MAAGYYDPTNGVDSGAADGSSGAPYASMQYLVDNFTWATSGGNSINGANTSADVLTALITWTASMLSNDGPDNPMVIRSWDNGGSLVITFPNGETHLCFEMDGNDAVSSIFSSAMTYVFLVCGKFHDTTGILIDPGSTWSWENCEAYGAGSTTVAVDGGFFHSSEVYVHSDGTVSGQDGMEQGNGHLANSWLEGFDGFGVRMNSSRGEVSGCYISDCDEGGAIITGDINTVEHCSITGNGTTGETGIHFSGTGGDANQANSNIVANFSGTSGVGIKTTSGGRVTSVEGNRYYNNTTNESFGDTPIRVSDNTTESSDPFTASASDDYSVVTGSDSYQSATSPGSKNPMNIGADQTDNAAGGGGSGVQSSFSF